MTVWKLIAQLDAGASGALARRVNGHHRDPPTAIGVSVIAPGLALIRCLQPAFCHGASLELAGGEIR